nr:MAG: hypothetical protein [Botourmiaviridae sp.]
MPRSECAALRRQRSLRSGTDKTTSGSVATVRCTCAINTRRTKEAIRAALKVVRARFALPRGELPDLGPSCLDKYLLKLLDSSSPTLPFPRTQRGFDGEGFPRLLRLSREDRWMLAHSCASIKRSLPTDSCKAHPPPSAFPRWHANACRPQPPSSSPEYLRFCRDVIRKEFPFGWDRTYNSFCESFIPRHSSRAEKYPSGIPVSSSDWWSENHTRSQYLGMVTCGKQLPFDGPHMIRYKEVISNGKCRPLGIPSVRFDLLGPLHKTVYQHLTAKRWLVRGRITRKRIAADCLGKFHTSVDLVNATDGLKLDVADTILAAMLSKARSVPGGIRLEAHNSLRPNATFEGRSYEVTHGQMMGGYLSFPLLCLQSYCAARWATRGTEASFLVNGDDTVISSSFSDVLARYPDGFEINRKKTKVSTNTVELNSTVFIKREQRGWKEVVQLRKGGALVYSVFGLRHLAVACKNAGPKWQSAFIRSGILKGTKVDSVDLGLDRWIHDVWRQSTSARFEKRVFPEVNGEKDDRLEPVYEEMGYEEAYATRELLFNEGRMRGGKEGKFELVRKLPISTMRRTRYKPLSYRPDIRDVRPKAREIKGFVVKGREESGSSPSITKEINGDVYLASSLWW